MKKNILLTGVGGDIAQGAITILRENRPDLGLIGIDIHENHSSKYLLDAYVNISPAAKGDLYIMQLSEIIKKHKISIVIPFTEAELELLILYRDFFKSTKLLMLSNSIISIGLDKLSTINTLINIGIPVPATRSALISETPDFPVILKSRKGSGSKTVFKVFNREEFAYFCQNYDNLITQELLLPDTHEVTCIVYRTKDGRIAVLQLLRRLSGGLTVWAETIDNHDINHQCELVANNLNLEGSLNIQMILTNNGPRIFEINPRFSSTILMRHRLGFTDLLWSLAECEGNFVEIKNVTRKQFVARTHDAIVINQ